MPAANYNLTIEQGATFSLPLQFLQSDGVTPVNLTGYTFAAKLRLSASDPNVLATFTTTVTPLTGSVVLSLTATETAGLTVEPSGTAVRKITTAAWDLEMTVGSTKYRVMQGIAKISPEVTK